MKEVKLKEVKLLIWSDKALSGRTTTQGKVLWLQISRLDPGREM